jgi:hypothetical protein
MAIRLRLVDGNVFVTYAKLGFYRRAILYIGRAGAKFFVETGNGECASAQKALLRMRLFSHKVHKIRCLRRLEQLFVQIAPKREIFGPFSRFSQRYPQAFPQILCKERVALPDKSR